MNELFLPIGLNIFNSINKGKIEFIYEDFNDKIPETSKLPLIVPAISEFSQTIFPETTPSSPITTFPEVEIVPSTFPSILKSA